MSTAELSTAAPRTRPGTPVWELAELYPPQGQWTRDAYLSLDTNRLIEYVDGSLEFLPVANELHQTIVQFLLFALHAFVSARSLGYVFAAPYRVELSGEQIREPDVVYHTVARRRGPTIPPQAADLVMEVISPGPKNRERDEVIKRAEYAKAGIPEYWLVDPENHSIRVLWLNGALYEIVASYGPGERAKSRLLAGFEVDVNEVFANQV